MPKLSKKRSHIAQKLDNARTELKKRRLMKKDEEEETKKRSAEFESTVDRLKHSVKELKAKVIFFWGLLKFCLDP